MVLYEPNYKHHIINYDKTVFVTLKPKATILYYTIMLCYITIIDVLFSLVMMKHPTRATSIAIGKDKWYLMNQVTRIVTLMI